jgi:serine/threonine protein kinase
LKNRYKVGSTLGVGAYGTVYLAEDSENKGAKVAVKEIVEQDLSPDERADALELFSRESRILMSLRHRGLPAVIDSFSADECHYLVMEYIEGETLEALLKKSASPFPAKKVTAWALELAKILEYLHTRKPDPVIFRDLKPSNIMLDSRGQIRLIDFGIARYFTAGKIKDTYAMGTPGYSPPEQYGHGQSDMRTDIFSLGVTLYHLLTNQDPAQFNFKFPSPGQYASSDVPDWFEKILMKCIALNPSDRFQSSTDLKYALENRNAEVSAGPLRTAHPLVSTVLKPRTALQKFLVFIIAFITAICLLYIFFVLLLKSDNFGSTALVFILVYFACTCLVILMGNTYGHSISISCCFILFVILSFLGIMVVPGFLRARAQGQLTACKQNLTYLGSTLENYYIKNGKYPEKLSLLTPEYLAIIPICPLNEHGEYLYKTSQKLDVYTVFCSGAHHTPIVNPDFPRYDSKDGIDDGYSKRYERQGQDTTPIR